MNQSAIHRWVQLHFEFRCQDCGKNVAIRSHSRTFSERYILPVFLLQPVRCQNCFRRAYRTVLTPVVPQFERPVSAKHIA